MHQHRHPRGSDFQVSVLDGAFAAFVEAEELGEDLLVLLADGLTEERLVALLKRWSKAPSWHKTAEGLNQDDGPGRAMVLDVRSRG